MTILWQLVHGTANCGTPATSYIHCLMDDVALKTEYLNNGYRIEGIWKRIGEAIHV